MDSGAKCGLGEHRGRDLEEVSRREVRHRLAVTLQKPRAGKVANAAPPDYWPLGKDLFGPAIRLPRLHRIWMNLCKAVEGLSPAVTRTYLLRRIRRPDRKIAAIRAIAASTIPARTAKIILEAPPPARSRSTSATVTLACGLP